MKRVAIVGGGYAGTTLARELDAAFDVVLIEPKDRFFHNVGAMRAYVDPALLPRLLIPYDRLLRRGRILQEEVLSAGQGGVRGAGWALEADIVVVATGSRHTMPFKNPFRESAVFQEEAGKLSRELAAAARVTILGHGPVGVELAGEIAWRYPSKRVRLAGLGTRLLEGAGNPRLGERVAAILRQRGVEVVFGGGAAPEEDLAIRAYGGEVSVPCLGAAGRVPVDGHFRVEGMDGVYAIGDAAACGEPALSFLARRQAAYLARYLQAPKIGPYRPSKRVAMSIPLGPELGATQLPLPGLPVAGHWVTSRLKGRDLFIGKNWALLGAA